MYQVYHAYRFGTLGTDSTRTFEFVLIFSEASGKASVAYGDFVGVLQIILAAVLL